MRAKLSSVFGLHTASETSAQDVALAAPLPECRNDSGGGHAGCR